jgi:hypothetical protein
MERLIEPLPDPSYIHAGLWGIDHSSITEQTSKLFPGLNTTVESDIVLCVKNPTKEQLLDIYRASTKALQEREQDITLISKNLPRLDLIKAAWYFGCTYVELTPQEIKIDYTGKEPDPIAQVRKRLEGTQVRLELRINYRQF